jgi:tetratricopeptide (TPR) repeat protein
MLGQELQGNEGLQRLRESVAAYRQIVAWQPNDQSKYELAAALGSLAFSLVLNGQFADAQVSCEEAEALVQKIGEGIEKRERDDLVFIQGNLAHALLFQGHFDEALAIYRENWTKPLSGKTFGESALEDFASFDKAGLSGPYLSRMKKALAKLRSDGSSP